MTMLTKLMEAGGKNNEDYRHPLRETKTKLNAKLLEIRHKNYADAHADLVKDELDVLSVTKRIKEQYREQLDEGKWPAASHAKDSKALNRNYGSVNMVNVKDIRKVVASLVQNVPSSNRDKSKDECNNCGQKGHWARDCPQKKKTRGANSRSKSLRNNPTKGGPKRGGVNRIPPKDGESEIKFIDGKKSYWCAKCKRWTLSHGTDGHVPKEQLKQAKAGMARLSMDLHPSAYATKGPLIKPSVNQTRLKRQVQVNYLLVGLLGVSFCYLLWQTPILEWLTMGAKLVKEVSLTGIKWMVEHWPMIQEFICQSSIKIFEAVCENPLPVSMGVLSGAIGFGTAAYVYKHAEGKPIRYRKSENMWKRAIRKERKTWKRSVRHNKVRRSEIPTFEMRSKLTHHPRLQRVSSATL